MGNNQIIILFLFLFICSYCSCASSLTKTSPSAVKHLQENKVGTSWEEGKLSGGGRGGMSGGAGGQTDGSNSQNPRGSSAVIPINAANAHHNNHHGGASRPDSNPTTFAALFSATLLAFLV